MLIHNVYFSLNDSSQAASDRLVHACQTLLSGHEGVKFFAVSVLANEFARDVNVRDYHVALHLVFADKEAHDKYQVSETHQQFIAENRDNWKLVRIFDSYTVD